MPEHERFMNEEQENGLDSCCSSSSEEDTWWNLFRLLIPGMDTRDISSLRPQYWPCERGFLADAFPVNLLIILRFPLH